MLLLFFICSIFLVPCISEDEHLVKNSKEDDYLEYMNTHHIYHAYTFSSGVGNRECLKVDGVNVDFNFKLGEGVKEWTKLKSKKQFWLVGIRSKGFTLINEKKLQNKSNIFERKIELDYEVKTATLFEVQNKLMRKKEIVLLVVVKQEILYNIFWYRIVGNDIEKFWEWPLLKKVTSLNVFKYGNDYNIVMAKDYGIYGGSLDLYRLHFNNSIPNIWFLQKIPLKYTTKSIAITSVVEDIYMSIVQNSLGIVQIYKYETFCPETADGKFVHHQYLKSENVTTVDTFFMASRNYLVINGDQAGIYIFNRNGDVPSVFKKRLGVIEEWMILQVDTYRDDIILLAQNDSVVTMIIWAGSLDGFIVKESKIHCHEVNERNEQLSELSADLSCLLKHSWKGSISANLGHAPVVVMAKDGYSYVYTFICSLIPVMDPEADILRVQYIKNSLDKQWNDLKKRYEDYGIKVNYKESSSESIPEKRNFEAEETLIVHGLDYWPSIAELEELASKISHEMDIIEENLLECESVLLTRNVPFNVFVEGSKKDKIENMTGFFNSSFAGHLIFDEPLIIERKENETIRYELSDNEISANGVLTFIPGNLNQDLQEEQEIRVVSGNLNDYDVNDYVQGSGPSQYSNPSPSPEINEMIDSMGTIVSHEISHEFEPL